MHHDERSNQPSGHSPACRPAKFLFPLAVLKLNSAGAREVLAEEMRRSGLDRLSVLHHCFKRQCFHGARKLFAFGFRAGENRNRKMVADKSFIQIQNQSRFTACLAFGFVNGVTFLPEKFSCAQKQPRPHFPANDVRPLIYENWQVAVGLHPLRVTGADDRF